jgi:hypothetical protein
MVSRLPTAWATVFQLPTGSITFPGQISGLLNFLSNCFPRSKPPTGDTWALSTADVNNVCSQWRSVAFSMLTKSRGAERRCRENFWNAWSFFPWFTVTSHNMAHACNKGYVIKIARNASNRSKQYAKLFRAVFWVVLPCKMILKKWLWSRRPISPSAGFAT